MIGRDSNELIHPSSHMYNKWQAFQKNHPDLILNITDYVKVPFAVKDNPNEVHHEWMWVRAVFVDNEKKEGIGSLENDPIAVKDMECGDLANFEYKYICEIIRGEQES